MRRTSCGVLVRLLTLTILLSLSADFPIIRNAEAQSWNLNQVGSQSVKLSSDLIDQALHPTAGKKVSVIVQLAGPLSLILKSSILLLGGQITDSYTNLDALAVTLPENSLLQLIALPGVTYVSFDRPVVLLGHLSLTSGADSVRTSNTTTAALDGSGIGIAVLDSGFYTSHRSLLGKSNNVRVLVNKDFTGEMRTDDVYGHGSHVASIAAGNGRVSNEAYLGIAPNANLLNLRVLDSSGLGKTARLLSALDWVINNRANYNIRVANLSLGAAAVDSFRNDPICKMVRQLVNAGVVVVAAAGNNGRDESGRKVYGQIHSPGIEPSAITVGASNTFGTDSRADDAIATYSSRGPTRSFSTDSTGTKHYDNLLKPDLVAPGNKIIAAEALKNLLVAQYPELDAGVSNVDNRKMMRLSGTSMATPVVAGAAALMLQANPKLTPNLVKAILMYTAQPLAGFNILEQGMGQVNIEGAIRLARLIRTDLSNSTRLGSAMLMTAPPVAHSTIAGYTFTWSQGLVLNYTYVSGSPLITDFQRIYILGVLLSDGVIVGDGVITGDTQLMTENITLGDNLMTSNGVIAGDGTVFSSYGLLLGDGVLLSDGQVLGDGVIAGDTSGVIAGDTQVRGDDTACMAATSDTPF